MWEAIAQMFISLPVEAWLEADNSATRFTQAVNGQYYSKNNMAFQKMEM